MLCIDKKGSKFYNVISIYWRNKMRLDQYLFINGFCDSRTKSQKIIKDGRVSVNGKCITKVSFEISDSDDVKISKSADYEFVGRGGYKLEHAFSQFSVTAKDKICVDIGASTGGFTECLLLYGAKKVYAVDSGTNQLSSRLKNNPRVISMEGFNARGLTSEHIDSNKADIIVMDVSFISQKLLYPAILNISNCGADIITLIKPQFEAGKQHLGKHGIVKDEKIRHKVVEDIINYAVEFGFEYVSHCQSPIKGGDGNTEYLLHLKTKTV